MRSNPAYTRAILVLLPSVRPDPARLSRVALARAPDLRRLRKE
jgi:hypothetical protein